MILPRREFLRIFGAAVGTAGMVGCGRDKSVTDNLIDLALRGPGIKREVKTVCGLCEGACGLTVRLVDDMPVSLKGNRRHPLNRGGLCPVGLAGLEILYAPDRVRGPLRRIEGGEHRPTTWDDSLGEIAKQLAELHKKNEGHRIAILVDRPGRIFYELAERFAGALGSPHIARTHDPRNLPYFLTQGAEEVPGFDLAHADLALSFGLDLYGEGPAPVHAISSMVGSRPTEKRGVLLHAGTRLSPGIAKADDHLSIHPGTHGALALGIAHVLVREGLFDRQFVSERTFGFEDWTDSDGGRKLGFRRMLMERYYPDRVAKICGCDPARLIRLARSFGSAGKPVAIAGGEALEGSNATWTAMSVHSLNALVGAFNRSGGVITPARIPLTPFEPMAEVEPSDEVSLFAPSPDSNTLGVDPIEALADRVEKQPGSIDILFVLSSNPVFESSVSDRLRGALKKIPTVVAVSPFRDETAVLADYILPSHIFLEGWQDSTTPPMTAFSVIGVGAPVLEPLFNTRHPGDLLIELAGRVGKSTKAALPWQDYPEYLKYRLGGLAASGQGSVLSGSFEESWVWFLEERGWRFIGQSRFNDFWKDLVREAGWWNPVGARDDWARTFQTPTGRFEFFSRALEEHLEKVGSRMAGEGAGSGGALRKGAAALGIKAGEDEACLAHYEPPKTEGKGDLLLIPFRPMTGRGRLGAASPMVLEMYGYPVLTGWETWVEISPETAHHIDLRDGDYASVESDRGAIEAVVRVEAGHVPGVVHIPLGLGHSELNGIASGVGTNPVDVLLPVHDSLDGRLTTASTRVHLRLIRRRAHGGPAPSHGEHG